MAAASTKVAMEYIFARDMVNVLVSRRVKDFKLEDERHNLPTPFCFRIRRAVEHFVTNEDLNINFAVHDLRAHVTDFKALLEHQRDTVLPMVRTLVALLKHFSVLCMMAAWHKKWGNENAPAQTVEEIRHTLVRYINTYDNSDIFWERLKDAAPFITKRPLDEDERQFVARWGL